MGVSNAQLEHGIKWWNGKRNN